MYGLLTKVNKVRNLFLASNTVGCFQSLTNVAMRRTAVGSHREKALQIRRWCMSESPLAQPYGLLDL